MKRIVVFVVSLGLFAIAIGGCSKDESSMERETKISTPGGTTTITTKKDVTQAGDNPPQARP